MFDDRPEVIRRYSSLSSNALFFRQGIHNFIALLGGVGTGIAVNTLVKAQEFNEAPSMIYDLVAGTTAILVAYGIKRTLGFWCHPNPDKKNYQHYVEINDAPYQEMSDEAIELSEQGYQSTGPFSNQNA